MSRQCKWCESVDHTSFYCRRKINKPIEHRGTRITNTGKYYHKWQETRNLWFSRNFQDMYTCHYCGDSIVRTEVTLDHIFSRSRRPDLRYELSNLVPACWMCNGKKKSRDHDEYVHVCHL